MWIFGYGSLMFDGWEAACGCTGRKWADLPGYRRSFNKKSVESRGTREAPSPEMLLDLQKREACNPRALAVQLEDGRTVTAQVFIYGGRNLIAGSMPLADKAAMVAKAGGIRGSNFDYVRDTYEGLKGVGVDDPAVTTLWEAVKKYPGQPKPL